MLDRKNLNGLPRRPGKTGKDFLLGEQSREFFLFLFFFLIAGGFWLLQTLNSEFEDEISVPVRLKGMPDDMVLTSDLPEVLRVKVKDRGTVLLNYKVGRSFLPVTIDFDKVKGRGNHVSLPVAQLEKQLLSQLSASSRLVAIRPDTVDFYYAAARSKRVPVRFQGRLTPAKTYFLADTLFRPDSVDVYAPAAVLDTIVAAYIQRCELKEVADTLKQTVQLERLRSVKFQPHSVMMELYTDVYTEAIVEVPLEGINFPADKVLRAFPSKVKVIFQIGKSRYKTVRADEFHLSVSYEELMKLGDRKYRVALHHVPEGVTNVRLDPEQVDFLIEQAGDDDGFSN